MFEVQLLFFSHRGWTNHYAHYVCTQVCAPTNVCTQISFPKNVCTQVSAHTNDHTQVSAPKNVCRQVSMYSDKCLHRSKCSKKCLHKSKCSHKCPNACSTQPVCRNIRRILWKGGTIRRTSLCKCCSIWNLSTGRIPYHNAEPNENYCSLKFF